MGVNAFSKAASAGALSLTYAREHEAHTSEMSADILMRLHLRKITKLITFL